MVNTAFALKFTTPCKQVSKCGIYHLCFRFTPSLHFFTSYLRRVNLCKSNFSCSVPTKQPDSRLLTKRLPKYHRLLFIRIFFPSLISSYTQLILDNQLAITIFGRREESIRWYEVDRWYICLKTSLLA